MEPVLGEFRTFPNGEGTDRPARKALYRKGQGKPIQDSRCSGSILLFRHEFKLLRYWHAGKGRGSAIYCSAAQIDTGPCLPDHTTSSDSLCGAAEKGLRHRVQTRIGLNSGPVVVVGSIGDDLRMDYTAQGDTTNLASRMETGAKPGTVLASGTTYRLARNFFEFASKGGIRVKGKEEGVEAYQLLKPGEVKSRISASVATGG